jgi:glycosyltransferase involved in cell wall biosynthesis
MARRAGHHGRLDPFLFPARRTFLENARAVVVHSDWAASVLAEEFPRLTIGRVALAAADPQPVDRTSSCAQLGIDPDRTILMHLGFLSEEKGLEAILTGVAAAIRTGIDLLFVVVGEGREEAVLQRVAKDLGLGDRVHVTGWIEAESFARIPAAADLGVVLRTPSAGETSAAALRFLACGVPVAMGGGSQFLEWPESAAPRITPGPSAPAELARLIAGIDDPAFSARRLAARAVYESSHTPEKVAEQLIDFVCGLGAD